MDSWTLPEIETPAGRRSPVVLHSGDEARVVLIVLDPGQQLGEHQVKEHAWIAVVDGRAEFTADGQTVDGPTGRSCTSSRTSGTRCARRRRASPHRARPVARRGSLLGARAAG